MSKLRSWLRLIRVAALPTALADVWLGGAVVGASIRSLADISIVSLLIYSAGMILNDVHDVRADRTDNPKRPLPMGEISVRAAALAGVALLALGIFAALRVSRPAFDLAILLAMLVLIYNFVSKNTIAGPLNMGLCRGLNVLLGVSAVGRISGDSTVLLLAISVPIFVYVTGITWLARNEAEQGARRSKLAMGTIGAGVLLIPALYWLNVWHVTREYASMEAFGALAFIAAVACFVGAITRGGSVRGSVGIALALIIPFEALVAAASLRPVAALIILALLAPAWLIRRLSHLT